MAAPRAESSEGLMAIAEVDGARMVVDWGKSKERFEAILGVFEVPPESITYRISMTWLGTFR